MPIRPLNDEGRECWGGFELATAGSTHAGRIRQHNEDAFDRFDDPERDEILLVVADGMGGHQGGEVASRMAVGTLGKRCIEGEGDPETRLRQAVEQANQEIYKRSKREWTLKGMGTTVIAVLLCPTGPSFIAHVGDSRLYRLRGGAFDPLTEDHSVVQLLIRSGEITPAEARDHPKRSEITRSVGIWPEVDIDIAPLELVAGDKLLLCSDGLYAMLEDEDMKTLAARAPDPHAGIAWMIDAANQAGGLDNITAMIADFRAPAA